MSMRRHFNLVVSNHHYGIIRLQTYNLKHFFSVEHTKISSKPKNKKPTFGLAKRLRFESPRVVCGFGYYLITVGAQNSSSNLFLGLEPHVRALACFRKKRENDTEFTVVQPMGPTST